MELKLRDGKGTNETLYTDYSCRLRAKDFCSRSDLLDSLRVCHAYRDRPNKYQSANNQHPVWRQSQSRKCCQ